MPRHHSRGVNKSVGAISELLHHLPPVMGGEITGMHPHFWAVQHSSV